MIAGHITVSLPEGMKGVAVIAYEKLGGSSVRDIVTAIETVTATETGATAATGIVTATETMTVIGIVAAIGIATEVETATETMTATGSTATAIAIAKIEESRIRFSYSAIQNRGTDIC